MGSDVFERVVYHKGQTFLHENTDSTDSYIVQSGTVRSYIIRNNRRINLSDFKSGDIIAEGNLFLDEKLAFNYEAYDDVTLIRITRHDFQKKMSRMDPQLSKVVTHLADKLSNLQQDKVENMLRERETDMQAREIVDHLLRDMDEARKEKYEDVLLPHFNVMVKALDEIRKEERHKRQKAQAKKVQEKARQGVTEKEAAE